MQLKVCVHIICELTTRVMLSYLALNIAFESRNKYVHICIILAVEYKQ